MSIPNAAPKVRVVVALCDLAETLAQWRVVVFLAMSDTRARYKRSVLGPLWLSLGTTIGSAGLGILWSGLLKIEPREFVPTLTAGLILWQFISGVIVEASGLFSRQAALIRNLRLPLTLHPTQLLLRHLTNLAHNVPVFLLVALWFQTSLSVTTLLAIPALMLVALNLFWIALILTVVGARFRDLEHIISSVMPLLMFISPVFFRPAYVPFGREVLWLNPLTHLIELPRDLLVGVEPPMVAVLVNLGFATLGGAAALALFGSKYNRIAYWI